MLVNLVVRIFRREKNNIPTTVLVLDLREAVLLVRGGVALLFAVLCCLILRCVERSPFLFHVWNINGCCLLCFLMADCKGEHFFLELKIFQRISQLNHHAWSHRFLKGRWVGPAQ